MTPTKVVNGERVEMTEREVKEARASWEYYRNPDGDPLSRRVLPDGEVLEDAVPVDESLVTRYEAEVAKREAAARGRAAKIQALKDATDLATFKQAFLDYEGVR